MAPTTGTPSPKPPNSPEYFSFRRACPVPTLPPMRSAHALVLAALVVPFTLQAPDPSRISGYVTAVTSSEAFDLEGVHIRLTPGTDFRTRTEYNPEAVTSTDRQSAVSKVLRGDDARKIPPYSNPVMEARQFSAIGDPPQSESRTPRSRPAEPPARLARLPP